MERKAGENTEKYSIFDFENPLKSRISGGRNDQVAVKFRVLHLRPLGQLSVLNYYVSRGKIFRQAIRQNIYLQNKYLKTLIFRGFRTVGKTEQPENF